MEAIPNTKPQQVKKLEPHELAQLKTLVQKANDVSNDVAHLCLSKEENINRINAEFKTAFDVKYPAAQFAVQAREEFIAALCQKYGMANFKTDTGEIHPV